MTTASRHSSHAPALALLAVLAIIGVACAPQHTAAGNKVLLIGDSLLDGSRLPVSNALESSGWDPFIKADGGRSITFWQTRVPLLAGSYQPGVMVIELGTNDCSAVECVPLGPAIDEIMGSVASTYPVLWLNVQEDVPRPYFADHDYVNSALEAADARWPNLYLVDLDGHFAGHPEWHGPDGLHFNRAGREEFARFLSDELDRFKP
jgi:lysophospholipase L1-like esterase